MNVLFLHKTYSKKIKDFLHLGLFILIYSLMLLSGNPVIAQKDSKNDALLYLLFDNDAIKIVNETDKYYSYGLNFGFQTKLSSNSGLLRLLPFKFGKKNVKYFLGTDLFLKGYTPIKNTPDVIKSTRPFAGILTLRTQLTSVTMHRLFKFGLEFGVRGPASGAEKIQTVWHNFAGKATYPGWKDQLPNEFLINTYGAFIFPVRVNKFIELIPETELALGNYNSYLQQGLMLRLGIFDNISSTQSYNTNLGNKAKKEIFLTGEIYFRVVAVDATLSREGAEKIGLGTLDKDNYLGGFELQVHMQANRFGTFIGYTKRSSDSNFTLRHSYGTIGLLFKI